MAQLDSKNSKLEQTIYAEKLRILYKQTFPAVFISLFVAGLLVYVLWDVKEQATLLKWFIFLSLGLLVRLGLFIGFWRISPSLSDTPAWGKPYFITIFITMSVWGFGIPSLMPENSPHYQLIVMFFLIGAVAGSVATYWPFRIMLLPAIGVLIFPTTVWLAAGSQNGTTGLAIAVCAVGLFFSLIRSGNYLSEMLTENLRRKHELKEERKKVEYLSRRDSLTNLYNHRAFYEQLNEIGAYCERHNESIAIIIANIDNLSEIEDQYGEAIESEVLEQLGKLFKKHTRISDICARLADEEFGILIRSSSLEEANLLAEKLKTKLAENGIEAGGQKIKVVISFGVSCSDTDFGNTVRKADQAMYEAKEKGGGAIVQQQ